jgi:hypothetical protein
VHVPPCRRLNRDPSGALKLISVDLSLVNELGRSKEQMNVRRDLGGLQHAKVDALVAGGEECSPDNLAFVAGPSVK